MSSKPSSGPSKTRSSTSRTRKTPSPRTKAAEAETGTEPSADEEVKANSTPTTSKKTPTRRRAATSRKKTAASTETEAESAAAIDSEATPEAPKRKTTTRRRATKVAATGDATVSEEAEKKPAKRTRRKSVTVEEAPATAEEGEVKAKPTTRRKTTRAKTDSAEDKVETTETAEEEPAPKTTRTRRKKAAVTKIDAPADDVPQDETAAAEDTPRATRKRTSTRKPKTAEATTPSIEPEAQPVEAASPHREDEEQDDRPRFADLALSAPILKAVEEMGYTHPTPIQALATPAILAGHDVLGVAQTGTGKTASFTLPLLEKLSKSRARARMPRSLILEPTRELALQVAENFKLYGAHLRLTHALLIGGGKLNEQRDILNRGVDVLIATPGRLLDMFDRGGLLMTQTDTLVIDEADRMLDMGFIPDIERIVSLLPRQRQTLFFSATMAPEIRRLADTFLNHPKEITIARQSSVASTITEGLLIVEKRDKNRAISALLRHDNVQNAIIFCNRKRDVDLLERYLTKQKFSVGHLHGDLAQDVRFDTLERFRSGELSILVCSDVAARGIDIGGLSHVVNYDLPFNAEDYVHRIGRTGRAGKEGIAYSLATPDEQKLLEAVEALTGKHIETIEVKDFPTLSWHGADGAVPSHKKGGTKNNRQERGKRGTEAKADEPATPKKKSSRNLLPEARKHDHKRSGRAELLPPVPETNGIQDGFGEHVPAFMEVSFVPEPRDPSDS